MLIQITHNTESGWYVDECVASENEILSTRSFTDKDNVPDSANIGSIYCTISQGFPPTCSCRSEILKIYLQQRPRVKAWFEKHVGMSVQEFCELRLGRGVAA